MRAQALVTAAISVLVFGTAFPGLGRAQQSTSQYVTMKWSFQNNYRYTLFMQLYAQHTDHVWPGAREYYKMNDSSAHESKIKCWEGEKICYGAWTADGKKYWGVGRNNSHRCEDCCVVCASGDRGTRILR